MGSSGEAGSTDRTRGLYMYSISPFYQKTFKGYSRELVHTFKSHFGWACFATAISLGGYGIVKWANHDFHRRGLKNPADYEASNE